MENTIYLTILYDYYKSLLTEKQCIYFEDYYFYNLSLSEIASNNHVTRSAVNRQINLTIEKLIDYESKLKLYENGLKIKELIKNLDEKTKELIEGMI